MPDALTAKATASPRVPLSSCSKISQDLRQAHLSRLEPYLITYSLIPLHHPETLQYSKKHHTFSTSTFPKHKNCAHFPSRSLGALKDRLNAGCLVRETPAPWYYHAHCNFLPNAPCAHLLERLQGTECRRSCLHLISQTLQTQAGCSLR